MKSIEIRRLVVKCKEIRIKFSKTNDVKLKEQTKQLEHTYYHETGRTIRSDLEEIA
jgi:hypothetical protein